MITFASFKDHVIILASFWRHLRIVLELFLHHFKIYLRSFWYTIEIVFITLGFSKFCFDIFIFSISTFSFFLYFYPPRPPLLFFPTHCEYQCLLIFGPCNNWRATGAVWRIPRARIRSREIVKRDWNNWCCARLPWDVRTASFSWDPARYASDHHCDHKQRIHLDRYIQLAAAEL